MDLGAPVKPSNTSKSSPLLAFPPARTGNYKVPSHVTEIADGAFDRAGISVLDASDCSVLEIRSLPSYIELRR